MRDDVRANTARPLDTAVLERAAADVARLDRDARTAWLASGSREDRAGRIGMLRTPALVPAGAADPALGPEAQRRLTIPHLARSRLAAVEGTGRPLPLEGPEAVARHMASHLSGGGAAGAG